MKIGCDISDVEKFTNLPEGFLEKYFTKLEIAYIQTKGNQAQTTAGIFSAKEAVFKTFQLQNFPILKSIEITHTGSIPAVVLHPPYQGKKIQISISHTNKTAIAYALLEE